MSQRLSWGVSRYKNAMGTFPGSFIPLSVYETFPAWKQGWEAVSCGLGGLKKPGTRVHQIKESEIVLLLKIDRSILLAFLAFALRYDILVINNSNVPQISIYKILEEYFFFEDVSSP